MEEAIGQLVIFAIALAAWLVKAVRDHQRDQKTRGRIQQRDERLAEQGETAHSRLPIPADPIEWPRQPRVPQPVPNGHAPEGHEAPSYGTPPFEPPAREERTHAPAETPRVRLPGARKKKRRPAPESAEPEYVQVFPDSFRSQSAEVSESQAHEETHGLGSLHEATTRIEQEHRRERERVRRMLGVTEGRSTKHLLRSGMLWSEILGPPRALTGPHRNPVTRRATARR